MDDSRSFKDEEARTRSKLANERTFAAWIRTSVTVMVVGLAIAQFVAEAGGGRSLWVVVIGGGYVVAGVALTGFAICNYLDAHREMKRRDFHAPKKMLIGIAGALALLSLALLAIVASQA